MSTRAEVAAAARQTLEGPEPTRDVGSHCTDPFTCPFHAYCSRGVVEPQWPISLLPNSGRALAEKWAIQGVIELTELPPGSLSNRLHLRIHEATTTGITYHDAKGAAASTAHWRHPRTWLDFETIAFVVPRWIGTRPWQQIPFQFSVHIEQVDGTIEHREFLSLDGSDPRRACAEALVAAVPANGAVVAYNASFERSCIAQLAIACPDLAAPLASIGQRLVDLLPVTREHWYHRDQKGSWSIKAVIQTIDGDLGYEQLVVKDGMQAQQSYLKAIAMSDPECRADIDAGLRAYCKRDTEAMLVLYRKLIGTPAISA